MADVRQFARDLYEWADRKGFKLLKPVDEDYKEKTDTAPAPAPPPDGQLYSVMISPDQSVIEYGQSMQFNARPLDVKGSEVQITGIKWGVNPPSIGTITQEGVFTPATDAGQGAIMAQAQQGQITTSGFATIKITPKPIVHHAPITAAAPQQAEQAQQSYQQQYPPQQQYAAQPSPQQPQAQAGRACATCGGPLHFSAQYNRWYCGKCQKWE
jgi:hypothetical protein